MSRVILRLCLIILLVALGALLPALPQPRQDFTFAIVGDRTGAAQPGVYEAVWAEIAREKPAFVINVGDTIQGGDDPRQEWEALSPLWKCCRFFLVPGNHDVYSAASELAWERQTGRKTYYGFDFEQANFTVLDNSRTFELSAAQLSFLRQDLERNRHRDPKFVFFHKPFWIVYVALGSSEFELHKIAREFGVKYVISGHGHQFLPMERDGIRYLEVGSSGARLRDKGFEKGWFYHHVLARVEGTQVTLTVKETGPPHGQGRTFRL